MPNSNFIEELEQARNLILNDNRPMLPAKVYVHPYGGLKVRYTHGCCIDSKYLREQIDERKDDNYDTDELDLFDMLDEEKEL